MFMTAEDKLSKLAAFQRVIEILKAKGIRVPDFQRAHKIESQKWNNWRKRGLPPKENAVMAARLGVHLRWLATGEGECFLKSQIDADNATLYVTLPIENPPKTTTFDITANIKLEICKNMTPSTIELAYNTKSNNLVTAIYRLMNISKEQDRLKVLQEINDLIQAEIDIESYSAAPTSEKPNILA